MVLQTRGPQKNDTRKRDVYRNIIFCFALFTGGKTLLRIMNLHDFAYEETRERKRKRSIAAEYPPHVDDALRALGLGVRENIVYICVDCT